MSMSKPVYNYSIRGIYATALSKLLLDQKQMILNASSVIRDRFSLLDSYENTVDVYIDDIPSKNGIQCQGIHVAIQFFENIFIKELEMPFISRPLLYPQAIIKGRIITSTNGTSSVLLKNNLVAEILNPQKEFLLNQELLVSIIRPVFSTKSKILVSDSLTISGNNLSLVTKTGPPEYSKNLSSERKKELEYLNLSLNDLSFPCSIHFFSSANSKSYAELLRELETLKQKLLRLLEDANTASIGQVLDAGIFFEEILFTAFDKTRLDQIRNIVVPTLKNHHLWRSMGENESESLTLMENVLYRDPNLQNLLEDVMQENLLSRVRNLREIEIFHWKPTGIYYKLGPAEVLEISEDHLLLRRISSTHGVYDGLNVKKETNDIMITYVPLGGLWWLRHEYYTINGILKGIYYNINTPVELCTSYISYFDLIVDVIKIPGKPAEIIDIAELKTLVTRGIIYSNLYNKIMSLAEQLKHQADSEHISNLLENK